jgi:hypothetical protein
VGTEAGLVGKRFPDVRNARRPHQGLAGLLRQLVTVRSVDATDSYGRTIVETANHPFLSLGVEQSGRLPGRHARRQLTARARPLDAWPAQITGIHERSGT